MTTGEVIALIKAFGGGGGGSSGGGVLVVGATRSGNKIICDKTCEEMWDAMKTGGVLVDGTTFVWTIVYATNNDGYTFVTFDNLTFVGDNDNDNPWASAAG